MDTTVTGADGVSTTSENRHDKGVDYASARAYHDQSYPYYNLDGYQNAIQEFDEAIQIDPSDGRHGRSSLPWFQPG